MLNCIAKLTRRFSSEEKGSATIEAVVWLPMFFLFLVVAADASFIFFGQNQAYRAVQDANRQWSVGRLSTPADVQTAVETALASIAPNASASSAVDLTGVITTTVTIPASDLVAVGVVTALTNSNVFATSSHLQEYF
jgi:Flp pilus assembly protein TadG